MPMKKKRTFSRIEEGRSSLFYEKDLTDLYRIKISRTKLKPQNRFQRCWAKIKRPKHMTSEELEKSIWKLDKLCLLPMNDIHEIHVNRYWALDILEDITDRADSSLISARNVVHLMWSFMTIAHHIQLNQKTQVGILEYINRKKLDHTFKVYEKLLNLIGRKFYRLALDSIITFYKEGTLWDIEFLCTELLYRLLYFSGDIEIAMKDILRICDRSARKNTLEARHVVQVLYEVLAKLENVELPEEIVRQLFNLYTSCTTEEPKNSLTDLYTPLLKGLRCCINNAIQKSTKETAARFIVVAMDYVLENENLPQVLLRFGEIVEAALARYSSFRSGDMPEDIYQKVLECMASKNPLLAILGIRFTISFFDTCNNVHAFYIVRIYFPFCHYNIKVAPPTKDRNKTFKQIRPLIHESFSNSIHLHCNNPIILQGCYLRMCTLITEYSCSAAAATVVCLAMAMQEVALTHKELPMIQKNHIHAMVVSALSFTCYVHKSKAQHLYSYVNKIIEKRAQWAPHLNPPLRNSYNYASHHILWDHPDFFFEDWQLRYGLWKCFKGSTPI